MISKTGLYVIRALSELAKLPPDAWMGTATLAQKTDAPVNYLGKLLHILAREHVILSQKGVRGGVRLARPPHQISLFEALEPFENFSRWNDCLLGKPTCPDPDPCVLNKKWGPIRERVLHFLQSTTAANLVDEGHK
ncbi:MAG: Rrf2 family transcriptional regulator [Candidatus Hydrogenedentes bacterium]|nr:Rrf2 family transcriptional regulator [Candidatus Hydrogenedentota bacterium]